MEANTTFGENVTLAHIGGKLLANESLSKTIYVWDSEPSFNLSSHLAHQSHNMNVSGYFIFAIGVLGFVCLVYLIYHTFKSPSFRSEVLETAPERIRQVNSSKSCNYHVRYYPETNVDLAVIDLEGLAEFSNELSDNQQSNDTEKLLN